MTDPSHTQASESAAANSHANALAQRYGAKPVRQRALSTRMWVLLAACVTVVAGAFVVWVQIDSQSRPSARDTGFTLISNDEAQGRFELSKNPQDTAVCSLKALNSSRVAVGWPTSKLVLTAQSRATPESHNTARTCAYSRRQPRLPWIPVGLNSRITPTIR